MIEKSETKMKAEEDEPDEQDGAAPGMFRPLAEIHLPLASHVPLASFISHSITCISIGKTPLIR